MYNAVTWCILKIGDSFIIKRRKTLGLEGTLEQFTINTN